VMDHQEFVAELSKNIPESWDGDEAIEYIIIEYVHQLELRLDEMGGSLERYPREDQTMETKGNKFIWDEIGVSRFKAHLKHGDNSIESKKASDIQFWLACLGEEFGEVCATQTYDKNPQELRSELIDLISVASAWIDAIDQEA
jgi:hypothetical protein